MLQRFPVLFSENFVFQTKPHILQLQIKLWQILLFSLIFFKIRSCIQKWCCKFNPDSFTSLNHAWSVMILRDFHDHNFLLKYAYDPEFLSTNFSESEINSDCPNLFVVGKWPQDLFTVKCEKLSFFTEAKPNKIWARRYWAFCINQNFVISGSHIDKLHSYSLLPEECWPCMICNC